jgi:hypothetical protein
MSCYLDQSYLRGSLNRSSYNLRQDYLGSDYKNRRDIIYEEDRLLTLKNKYNIEDNRYHDPIVCSLKRDQIYMSKHNTSINKTSLISTQLST